MPRNLLTRARTSTVKTPLTPGDWLLSQYERKARDRRRRRFLFFSDPDGDPTVHIQPMIELKSDDGAVDGPWWS